MHWRAIRDQWHQIDRNGDNMAKSDQANLKAELKQCKADYKSLEKEYRKLTELLRNAELALSKNKKHTKSQSN
jgi:hypothetical protein